MKKFLKNKFVVNAIAFALIALPVVNGIITILIDPPGK